MSQAQSSQQTGNNSSQSVPPSGSATSQEKYIFSTAELQLLEKNGWLDVKEKAERLVIAYEQKYMAVIKRTIELLDLMLEATLESFTSQQIVFFIDEILFTVIKNVIDHKEYQQEENYLITEQIIMKTLALINQSIHLDIPKLSEILAYIFNTQRSFYQKTILNKGPPQHDYPLGYEFERDEERRKWEDELKIGDTIDCIKFECFQRRQIWSRAVIERMDDTSVSVKYLNDSVDDKIFTKSSYQIAPLGTKSLDFDWREQLQVNDEIDIADSFNIWQNATVLDSKVYMSKGGVTEKQLYIGMRVYREDGDKIDIETGKKYFGWSEQFDEWVSPHSARVQKFNRLSRKLYKPASTKNFIDNVDDANDILFEQENQKQRIYAIQRADKNNNLVRYINYFGQLGGFDKILKRLQNYQDWCPIELIQYYLESIQNIHLFLFLDFVKSYAPPLWQAVQHLLMNPSEANLRTYDKEKLESIIGSLEVLLSRVFSYQDQIQKTEKLSMDLALKCYQTDVLKQRLAGLKLICEIIKYVKSNSNKSAENLEIKPPKFVEWIKKNNIIEDLYINNIHSEVINRSAEFFKFMLNQNLFSETLAKDMFNAIERQDQMTKQGFLKLLSEISSEPRRSQAKYIIQNIQKTEPKELTIEHIEVIYELALKQLQNITITSDDKKSEVDTSSEEYLLDTGFINKNTIDALYYFYDLIIGKDFQNMSQELKAKIIDRFSCLIRIDDGKTQRIQFLIKCIDDIKRNVSVYHLLQIIKQIISTYFTELQLKGNNNQNSSNNNGNLLIKLNPANEEKDIKLTVPDENKVQGQDSKKRNADNLLSINEEENNDLSDSPQKKKNRTDIELQKPQTEQTNQNNTNNENQATTVVQGEDSAPKTEQGQPKSKIADMLVNEHKLVDTILQNIRQVKANYKKKLDSTNISQNEKKELLKQFKVEVAERIDFIKFINSILEEEKKIITTPFLCSVWKDIVENPLDIDERDLLYKWLRELADEKGGLVNEVAKFFKQQLLQNTEFVEHLSFEGFLCYKVMFISLNLQQNYLQQQSNTKTHYTTNLYGTVCSVSGGPNNQNSSEETGDFEYTVLTEPSNLEGMDLLWEIVYKNGLDSVIESSVDFLVKLHLHISPTLSISQGEIRKNFIKLCMNSISSSIDNNQTKVKRTIDILHCLLNESEKKGIGYLKPLNGLVKGEVQNLTITNDITNVSEGQKKQDIKIESNKTIIDLKILIASKVNTSWDQIKIKRSSNFKQLRDSDNSRTIGEIRFKSNENLTIERRQTPPIPESNLLTPEGNLVEKVQQIFTQWFETFSNTEGLMDAENLAKFIHSCTSDNCRPDDCRVTGTISQWDHDKDGKLDLTDFLNFYKNACQEKKSVVWKNLHSHYYRNDLKKLSEVGEDIEDIEILPRSIIMQNHQFYEILIRILDNDQVSENTINLLNRLPASPDLVRKILNLEGVKGQANPDWSSILDIKNSYRLLYTLTLIEYLMEDNESQQSGQEEQNQGQQEQKTQDESQEQNQPPKEEKVNKSSNQKDQKNSESQPAQPQEDILKKLYSQGSSIDPANWREEFIQCGGFDQLFKVFIQYSSQDYSKLGVNTKNILSFILRIMKNYLTAVFANKVNHLYKINQYAVQVKYSLDVINENLKKAEEQKDGGEEEEKNKEESKEQSNQQSNNQQKQTQTAPQVIPYHPNVLNSMDQNANQNISAPIVGAYSKINFSIWANRTRVKETPDFLILKEKLSGKLGQKILDTLDIESMLDKIVEILFNVVSIDTELESEDRVIIDFCWCIIIDIALYDQKQRQRLANYNTQLFQSLIMKGLFNQNLNARRVFSHALYLISRQDKGVFSAFLLDLLMKNVPSSKDVSKSDCNQYYEILCKIIEESKDIENVSINFQNLMNDMVLNIKNHISLEARYNARNDKMLIGFLNMCEKILKIEPNLGKNLDSFADYLFDICLFCKSPEGLLDENLDFEQIQQSNVYEFNPPYYVKCKSSDSRRAAYKILISILKSNKQIFQNIINDGLNVLIDTLTTPSAWNYRPSNEQKCHQNYLGIRNLSQICYMNSMLQQFYMTKTFRYAILATDDEKEPELVEYRGLYIDDNVLHQIQKMFAFLDLSDRQDFNPTGFCFSFKDYSGKPVNVGVQQDAQEFLNMIFEKLETSLRGTPYKYILESIYGGQTISQMTCSACGNVKAKHELFYTQSLRVEGCKKIQDSFNKMIEGETISDFKCDACEKRCDQFRRICFSQLPNILIIQLQRIVFDLDTFVNKKINTKLEFPHNLDLKEYTVEYLDHKENELKVERKESNNSDSLQRQQSQGHPLKKEESQTENKSNIHPPEYYKYRLKGVTVHQGTAELGHYYSYINYKEDKWLEFNDSKIREFNPQNIEQECFGGSSSNYSENYWEKGDNSKNAYILVYERELKTPLKIVTKDEKQKEQVEKNLSIKIGEPQADQQKSEEQITCIDYYSINQRIPKRQFIQTWIDNHNFMLEKHVYSTEFLQFLKELIWMVEKPKDYVPSLTAQSFYYKNYKEIPEDDQKIYFSSLMMCAKLFFNIFYKSADFEILKDLLVHMKSMLDLIPQHTYEFAKQFIFDRFKQIESVLTACSEGTVRTAYQQMINFTINNLISFHNISLTLPEDHFVGKEDDQLPEAELVEKDIVIFLEKILEIMHTEVSKNWLRMQQYLEIFRDFSYGGEVQVAWCFKKEMIARLIDFFLGNQSPLNCYGQKKHEIGNRFVATPFGPLLQCTSYLISKVKWNMNSDKVYEFSENDKVALNNQEFFWKSMQENYDSQSICYIGQFMSHKDRVFSMSFGRLILRGINKANGDHIKQYLDLMSSYLAITDEFQQQRVEWIFGYGNIKINPNDSYEMRLNLDEQIVSYDTRLKCDNTQSVLNFLFHYRKLQENLCLHLLHRVLLMCKSDQFYRFLHYLMKLPAPSYSCAHYLSWVRPHLESIISDNQKNFIGNQKEELAKQCLAIYEDIEKVINNYAVQKQNDEAKSNDQSQSSNSEQSTFEKSSESSKTAETQPSTQNDQQKQSNQQAPQQQQEQSSEKGLKSLWVNYIVGKTVQVEENMWMPIGENNDSEEVFLREMEYTVYYTDSQPNGSTNLIFPESVKSGSTIIMSSLNFEESNISDFIYIHNPNANNLANSSLPSFNPANKNNNKNGNGLQSSGSKKKEEDDSSIGFQSAQHYYQNLKGKDSDTKDYETQQYIQEMFEGKSQNKNQNITQGNQDAVDDEDADDEDENAFAKKKRERHRQNYNLNIQTKSINQVNQEAQAAAPAPGSNSNQGQMFEMEEVQNAQEQSDKDATDSYPEDASIDSNKAHVGEDFSLSGLPSTSNYTLTFNADDKGEENSDADAVIVSQEGKLNESDEKTGKRENQEPANQTEAARVTDQNKAAETNYDIENQIKNNQNNKSNVPAAPSTDNMSQQSQALVIVSHVLNVKKEIGNVIRRFIIDNSTQNKVCVTVKFYLQDENSDQSINQHMPFEIQVEVEPKSTHTFFSMRKINPNREWSQYTISTEYVFQECKKPEQQAQSNQNQQQTKSTTQNIPQESTFKKTQSEKADETPSNQEQIGNNEQFNYQDDEFLNIKIGPQLPNKLDKDYFGMKQCPVCTFEQSEMNNVCEICESSLS